MTAVKNRLTEKLASRGDKKFYCPYISCGFPTKGASVPMLLALQKGGADIIELGVPFSEPQADGPVIQSSNYMALCGGTTMQVVFDTIKEARAKGLEVPIVLMGYLNPILQYREPAKDGDNSSSSAKRRPPASIDTYMKTAKESGVDAFIIVDMPPDDPSSAELLDACRTHDLCFVPLLSPTTTPERLGKLCEHASGFVYAVSQLGVTGRDISRSFNPESKAAEATNRSDEEAALDSGLRQPLDLPTFIGRVRDATKLPIAVGFGIKSKKDFDKVTELCDMGVVGSQCIRVVLKHLEEDEKGRPKLLSAEEEKVLMPKIVADLESYTREMSSSA